MKIFSTTLNHVKYKNLIEKILRKKKLKSEIISKIFVINILLLLVRNDHIAWGLHHLRCA